MKIINLKQHGPHWHNWRDTGIGSSDASVLMGGGFKTTRDQLVGHKVLRDGVDIENAAMARGKRLEPFARRMYEDYTGRKMKPICVEHDRFPWIRASLDGWCEKDGIILEIKCPGDWNHKKTLLKKEVPWYYKPQVMHQLLACDRAIKVHFISFTDSDMFQPEEQMVLVEVLRDQDYLDKLFQVEARAYLEIQEAKKHLEQVAGGQEKEGCH